MEGTAGGGGGMSLKGSNEAGASGGGGTANGSSAGGGSNGSTLGLGEGGVSNGFPPSDGTFISVDCGVSRGVSSVSGKSPKGSSGFGLSEKGGGVASERAGGMASKEAVSEDFEALVSVKASTGAFGVSAKSLGSLFFGLEVNFDFLIVCTALAFSLEREGSDCF